MNQDLVMIGYMGLSGTDKLIALEQDKLSRRLPVDFLEQAVWQYRRQQEGSSRIRQRFQLTSGEPVRPERDEGEEKDASVYRRKAVLDERGIVRVRESGQDGLFQGLWRLSRSWGTGFTVHLKDVPVRQETIEVCEILEVNPYDLESADCLWVAAEHGRRLCIQLREEGIPAAVIGELTDSNDCLLVHDDTVSYLNRPQEEEFSRYQKSLMRKAALPVFSGYGEDR